MPYPPKLSPVLNNCALHAFVPEITNEIDRYAGHVARRTSHTPYYEKLKDIFAQHYQLPVPFSFKQFSDLLHSYNPHDRQIIIGPVLRKFMRKTAEDKTLNDFVEAQMGVDLADAELSVKNTEARLTAAIDEARKAEVAALAALSPVEIQKAADLRKQKNLAVRVAQERFTTAYDAAQAIEARPRQHYLNSLTEIGHNKASFRAMSPVEAHRFIGNPLGISLTYHQDKNHYSIEADDPIASIHMHHQGSNLGPEGHWELTEKGKDSLDYAETTQLEDILPLLGENPHVTEAGLNLLSEHVRLRAQKVPAHDAAYGELRNTANTIEKFLFNVERVPPHIAKDLLGTTVSKPVADFIHKYKPEFQIPDSEAKVAMDDPEQGRRLKMPPQEFLQNARAVKKAHEIEESQLKTQEELVALEKSMTADEKDQYQQTLGSFSNSLDKNNQETMGRYKLTIATLVKERDKIFSLGSKLNETKDADKELAAELQNVEYKKAGM